MSTNSLLIRYPRTYLAERKYAFEVLLREFLGLEYECTCDERNFRAGDCGETIIRLASPPDGPILRVLDGLFRTPQKEWLGPASLPKRPLLHWSLPKELWHATTISRDIPVIYGTPLDGGSFYSETSTQITLSLDVFGSAFFMLTRYEEAVCGERDGHGRFPASASLAYQEGFLDRPIVDEYTEILRASMARLWPSLSFKERTYSMKLTHDVDNPSAVLGLGAGRILHGLGGDLLKRKDVKLAARRLGSALLPWFRESLDPFNTFDYIMEMSERLNIRSAFYFMGGRTEKQLDGNYEIEAPWIRRILRKIHARGHEIGLHGSYHSAEDSEQLKKEWHRLQSVLDEEGISQPNYGGRQHYLRWDAKITWPSWAQAGLTYSSTLGFPDVPGFRCGTCLPYPVFDVQARQPLRLQEHPLIFMEASLLDRDYIGLKVKEAEEQVFKLARACKLVKGKFVILWHNDRLASKWQKCLYERVLEAALS